MRYILTIILLLAIFVPSTTFAQTGPTGGIVPCGYGTLPSCNLCHLYTGAKNIIDFMLFDLILPVAIIALLIGGIFMLASMGNPQMLQTGKTAITNTIIGVIIAFGSWLIIATIVNTLGYKGFTAAWNEPPTCKASLAGTKPPPGGAPSKKFCVKPSPSPGVPATCEDKGNEETCLSGCPGGTCKTSCPPSGGTCSTVPSGPCSVSNLNGSCFGSGLANQASQICGAESGGDAGSESRVDRATGGGCPQPYPSNNCPHSAGLFQINFAKHSLGSLSCPNAFQTINDNGVTRYKIVDQTLYSNCLAAAKTPAKNITAACKIHAADGWKPWSSASSCGL